MVLSGKTARCFVSFFDVSFSFSSGSQAWTCDDLLFELESLLDDKLEVELAALE
jgi:hypothetical protein